MPPKRKQEGVYSILELSPEARDRAIDRWREKGRAWDGHDSEQLSEDFEGILSERGFSDPKTCWSLSSSQGDGVAFWGHLRLPDFFKWVFSGEKAAQPFVKEAKKFKWLEDVVRVRVTNPNSHYCHWNSMSVEVELTGTEEDLVPKEHRDLVHRFFMESRDAMEEWHRARERVERAMSAPHYEWDKLRRERSKLPRKGPKEWRPAFNKPEPEPLDLPMPPEPKIQAPAHIKRMMAVATKRYSELDAESSQTLNELEKLIHDWVKDTSKELEALGYAEMEYHERDEFIIEFFDGNDFKFDEDGEKL